MYRNHGWWWYTHSTIPQNFWFDLISSIVSRVMSKVKTDNYIYHSRCKLVTFWRCHCEALAFQNIARWFYVSLLKIMKYFRNKTLRVSLLCWTHFQIYNFKFIVKFRASNLIVLLVRFPLMLRLHLPTWNTFLPTVLHLIDTKQ